MNNSSDKKHGFVAVVGAPNAGKSTITNALLGQKLSIVSPKVQTTRNSIRAIVVLQNTQIILIDTPGIFIPRDDKILERVIVKSAWQGLREANHICFVIDVSVGLSQENIRILNDLKKENLSITVILNKIDLVKKSKMLEIFAGLINLEITDIIPVSAIQNDGIDNLRNLLAIKCQNPDWLFDEEQITDAPMRFIASEITREKLFLNLHKELPYSIAVKTDNYEIMENGNIKIHQTIFVLKDSQKSIIVGKNGSMIKKIGQESRLDIADIAGNKVHLYLFVKVSPDWMRNVENFEKLDLEKLPKEGEKKFIKKKNNNKK